MLTEFWLGHVVTFYWGGGLCRWISRHGASDMDIVDIGVESNKPLRPPDRALVWIQTIVSQSNINLILLAHLSTSRQRRC